jgi:hypothetical protein
MVTALEYWFGPLGPHSSARRVGLMTPTQRRYLEHAVRCQGGELRWTVRTSGEGTIHRMVKHLVAVGLVAFDAKRMAWVVTRAGRAAVKEGPGIRSRPNFFGRRPTSMDLIRFG